MDISFYQRIGRFGFLAVGILLLGNCALASGQSVATPPKKSPRMLELENQIVQRMDVIKKMEASIAVAEKGTRDLQVEIADLKKLENTMSVSAESYPEVLKTLHSQRVQLLIDLAGIDARFGAIEKAIERLAEKRSASTDATLKKLVQIRTKELDRVKQQFDQGTISGREVNLAEIALLEAKTRIAQMASESGGMLDQLNGQLLDTSLEKAEKSARLDKAILLIEEADKYREFANKLDSKRRKLNSFGISRQSSRNAISREKEMISLAKKELEQLMSDQR